MPLIKFLPLPPHPSTRSYPGRHFQEVLRRSEENSQTARNVLGTVLVASRSWLGVGSYPTATSSTAGRQSQIWETGDQGDDYEENDEKEVEEVGQQLYCLPSHNG